MTPSALHHIASAAVPTRHGTFSCVVFEHDGLEQVAMVRGDVDQRLDARPVMVRVHSECLTGDVFGSRRCDCGEQLDAALARIAAEERGVLVYLRGHEGRGIGLGHKIIAYGLQDQGLDTVDANLAQGLPADARDYGHAAAILHHLGVGSVRLITNNPAKCDQLAALGIEVVERVAAATVPTPENEGYLRTKAERMGHLIDVAAPAT